MSHQDLLQRAVDIAGMAAKAGAGAAEAFFSRATEREVRVRNGRLERSVEASSSGCGLRVDMGARQGFASTTDLTPGGLRTLVEMALAHAENAPEDPDAAIPEVFPKEVPDLELEDPALSELQYETAFEMARRTEAAALESDPNVTPGEGSVFSHGRGEVAIATTTGVSHSYAGTNCSLVCSPVASREGDQQRQTWYESRRFLADLPAPSVVGSAAGTRAARMLGARTMASGRAPVVFDALEGARFWGSLIPALLGDSARRGVSFLARDLGRTIGSPHLTLVEDPWLPRALGSRPVDGEGLPTKRLPLIENGVLSAFLYDSRTARRDGTKSTGSAVRGYSAPPNPGAHAPRLLPGNRTPEEILKAAGKGLYVTQLLGFGTNLVTGDYSRGANGWWFEGGEFAYPVQEVTLSGNLREMLRGIALVGDDLVLRSAAASPTFLIESMVISGGTR